MARRYYSSTARRTTLAADINSSVTSLTVAAVSGWPSSFPYTLVLDEGTLSEELVEVSARSGTTVTVTRGVDGTSAVAHTAGATVNHGVSARDFNEPNQFLNEGGTVTGATVVEANSSSAALRITQTGAGNALLVEDSANPDATPFVVDASGFVVHNHTSSISVAGVNPRIQSHSLTTNPVAIIAAYNWTNGTQPAGLTFVKSRSTTPGSFSAVQSGDQAGSITFFGDDGTQFVPAALIQGVIDGTPGTNDMPGRLVFSTTADGASTPTERMRIASNGDVGIGTTPTQPLEVRRDQDANTALLVSNQNAGSSAETRLVLASNGGNWRIANGSAAKNTNALTFEASGTERLRITSAGNVGIGTSSPSAKLEAYSTSNSFQTPIVARNDQAGSGVAAIGFNVASSAAGDTSVAKAAIGLERQNVQGGGSMVFCVDSSTDANPVAAGDEKMRITQAGNVGIGTSSPGYPLDVVSDSSTQGIRLRGRSSDNIGVIEFRDNASTTTQAAISTYPTYLSILVPATERMRIDNAGLITGSGTSLGAWTAYTPTLGGTGWAIGNGAFSATYCQIGKCVIFKAQFTAGSTTTFGSDSPTITLPITSLGTARAAQTVTGWFLDASAGSIYQAAPFYNSTTTVSLRTLGASGLHTTTTATVPFAWDAATGDVIRVSGIYEIA